MALGDKTKKPAFEMWKAGKALKEIQKVIQQQSTTKPSSVKGWVMDWERGRQTSWNPKIR
jgi:hypothetical protein